MMKNFNRGGGFNDKRGGSSFGRRDSGGRSFNGRGGNDRPEMFSAICAECGQACEVPFKPTTGRPVLCSHCFKGKDGSAPRQSGGRDFSRPDNREFSDRGDRGERSERNDRNDRNDRGDNNRSQQNNVSGEQFSALNAKLDQILHALEHLSPAKSSAPVVSVAVAKEAVAKKVVKDVKAVKTVKVAKAVTAKKRKK